MPILYVYPNNNTAERYRDVLAMTIIYLRMIASVHCSAWAKAWCGSCLLQGCSRVFLGLTCLDLCYSRVPGAELRGGLMEGLPPPLSTGAGVLQCYHSHVLLYAVPYRYQYSYQRAPLAVHAATHLHLRSHTFSIFSVMFPCGFEGATFFVDWLILLRCVSSK